MTKLREYNLLLKRFGLSCILRPWYFDSQTKTDYTAWAAEGEKYTLTDYRNKQQEQGCRLMEKTACDGVPAKTEDEIELGTLDENINWTCTNGVNGGSLCTKSCAASHHTVAKASNTGSIFQVYNSNFFSPYTSRFISQ